MYIIVSLIAALSPAMLLLLLLLLLLPLLPPPPLLLLLLRLTYYCCYCYARFMPPLRRMSSPYALSPLPPYCPGARHLVLLFLCI